MEKWKSGRVSLKCGWLAVGGLCAGAVVAAQPSAPRARVLSASEIPVYGYAVVNSYPHDAGAFTQGLIYRDGFLFESTGLHGRSTLRKVRLETGEVLQRFDIDPKYFAEGLAEWNGTLIQLTWQTNIGFVYDVASFRLKATFGYRGEGWGLTHNSQQLILSDGTPTLRFLDPSTFKEARRLTVRDDRGPVDGLNELEFVRGMIFANVWLTDRIAMISPRTGVVEGWLDLQGLLPPVYAGADVLNGIAYDARGDRLFVTGKLWPRLFEIRRTG